jgi:hypothetical protein
MSAKLLLLLTVVFGCLLREFSGVASINLLVSVGDNIMLLL